MISKYITYPVLSTLLQSLLHTWYVRIFIHKIGTKNTYNTSDNATRVLTSGNQLLCIRSPTNIYMYIFPSHLLSSPLYSLPPSRNSDPGSHSIRSRLFPPPYPLRFVPCIFIGKRFQLFLPSSTRVELCLPTLGALSS